MEAILLPEYQVTCLGVSFVIYHNTNVAKVPYISWLHPVHYRNHNPCLSFCLFVDPILKSLFHFLGVIMDQGKHDQGTFCDFPTGWDQARRREWWWSLFSENVSPVKTQVHVVVSAGFYIIPRSDHFRCSEWILGKDKSFYQLCMMFWQL